MLTATPAEPDLTYGTATALVYDDAMMMHEAEDEHPEQPARIRRIFDKLSEEGLVARCTRVPARSVTTREVAAVHTPSYVREVQQNWRRLDEDALHEKAETYNSIFLNPSSAGCAELAAGSCCEVVAGVVAGDYKNAVAVVRPPGHHAEAGEAMGFCIFNNVAVAAQMALDRFKLTRVLIVDWDVHHGNGTQNMFEDDPRVLYFSTHRWHRGGFYPGGPGGAPTTVGTGAGAGTSVNVGWNDIGVGDADYLMAWHRVLLPIAYEFAPQLVIVSAGFDAARGDPLGQCDISPTGYAHLLHPLTALAGGKVVVCLEGGYNLTSISRSYAWCTRVLLGETPPPLDPGTWPKPSTVLSVEATVAAHKPYWKVFGGRDAALGERKPGAEEAAGAAGEGAAPTSAAVRGGGGLGGAAVTDTARREPAPPISDSDDDAGSEPADDDIPGIDGIASVDDGASLGSIGDSEAVAAEEQFASTIDRLVSELSLGDTASSSAAAAAAEAAAERKGGDGGDGGAAEGPAGARGPPASDR